MINIRKLEVELRESSDLLRAGSKLRSRCSLRMGDGSNAPPEC